MDDLSEARRCAGRRKNHWSDSKDGAGGQKEGDVVVLCLPILFPKRWHAGASRVVQSIFSVKRLAFHTIRSVVSRKKDDFSPWLQPDGAVSHPRILPFSQAKRSKTLCKICVDTPQQALDAPSRTVAALMSPARQAAGHAGRDLAFFKTLSTICLHYTLPGRTAAPPEGECHEKTLYRPCRALPALRRLPHHSGACRPGRSGGQAPA